MSKRSILISLVVTLGLVVIAGLVTAWWLFTPMTPEAETQKVVIPKGASVSRIATVLHQEGLVRHPLVFRVAVQFSDIQSQLQAGTFELSPAMTPQELALTLTQGTQDIWITLLEGWRREEMADYLAEQELSEFDEILFLERTATLEGTLYPDTYLIPREIETLTLISLLTNTFNTKVTSQLEAEFSASSLTDNEIITLASLVEREAKGYEQMRHVAGILYNRLDIGMPLQVDASLQYIKGYDQATQAWWTPPLAVDKQLNSEFNTYLNPGLPPAPIANPGVEAIKAVLDHKPVDDLFYIHAPDGSFHYAQTLEQHNANVNRYLR